MSWSLNTIGVFDVVVPCVSRPLLGVLLLSASCGGLETYWTCTGALDAVNVARTMRPCSCRLMWL